MLSDQVANYINNASWIRKMFEAGTELKAQFGADKVYDFSLGNPDTPPPAAIGEALADMARTADQPFAFGYMPNPGYPETRASLAKWVSKEQGVEITASDVIMTGGAAGGLNVFLRATVNYLDQVLGVAPYFIDYGAYADNNGARFSAVPAKPGTFDLDVEALEAAINEKTRVVLINSPNNPTGRIYPKEQIDDLAAMLTRKSEQFGRPIFLLSDEPYRALAYDGVEVPSVLTAYPYSVVCSSFAKNLALAGERVGYLAIAPSMPDKEHLMNAFVFANRILGFINAPAIGQRLVTRAMDAGVQVDISIYDERRKVMARVLDEAGLEYTMPQGAFYFFPRVPDAFDGDDVAFCSRLQEERILAVPGRGFGYPGYVRLAYCMDKSIIENSAPSFKAVMG